MKLLKNIFSLVIILLYATRGLLAMDDNGQDHNSSTHSVVFKYIAEPSDAVDSEKTITLTPLNPSQPLIIHEDAKLELTQKSLMSVDDHFFHYCMGTINRSVFKKTGVCHINYLMLGLDALYTVQCVDALPTIKRKTSPLLYNRATNSITIIPGANTELCVFLSFGFNYATHHQNVINLSKHKPWNIEIDGKVLKVYFHPSNMAKNPAEKQYMGQRFPNQNKNFDSEINAVYILLQNTSLVKSFLETIEPQSQILSLGIRYYSFLDMCGRCQTFLEENQAILRPLFVQALQQCPQFQGVGVNTPFLAVAHSNRIYTKNGYSGRKQVSVRDYPYATSGAKTGIFLERLPKYAGIIRPLPTSTNRLIAFVHEPDLGDGDEYGIVRQYFYDITEVNFSGHGLKDKQTTTLTGKLERSNPTSITTINLSQNSIGFIEPEFDDDPIPLTDGRALRDIFNFMSHCSNLQELRIAGNHLTQTYSFDALLKALPTLRQLRVLDLADVGGGESAGSRDIEHLLKHIGPLNFLESLNLNHDFIYVEGAQAITTVLPNLPHLRELHLAYGALCHKDGRESPSDPYLDCLIYDPGSLFALGASIGSHPALQFIDIRHYTEQIKPEVVDKFIQIITGLNPNVIIESEGIPFPTENEYEYGDGEDLPGTGSDEDDL